MANPRNLSMEEVTDPSLPIVDAHHHLHVHPHEQYMLNEFLRDAETGHNIQCTAPVESSTMYRTDGPDAIRPVGETEFLRDIAGACMSGNYGPTRVSAGIVGYADLQLGNQVEEVLDAHMAPGHGRFRGVRATAAWDACQPLVNTRMNLTGSRHLIQVPS